MTQAETKHISPDFLIIGAMKAGTTTLFEYLRLHPDLSACRLKEPSFFARQWDKGWDWYNALYRGSKGLRYEASTDYTKYPQVQDVPRKLAEFAPEAKLIYMLRHPVKRVLSHIHHNLIAGRMQPGAYETEEFWNGKADHYLDCSRYHKQIQQYLKYFDRDRILVVQLEDMIRDRDSFLNEVANFLDVDPAPLLEATVSARNVSSKKAGTGPFKVINQTINKLQEKGLLPGWAASPGSGVERPELSIVRQQHIWDAVEGDVRQLEAWLGKKLGYNRPQ